MTVALFAPVAFVCVIEHDCVEPAGAPASVHEALLSPGPACTITHEFEALVPGVHEASFAAFVLVEICTTRRACVQFQRFPGQLAPAWLCAPR